MSDGYRCDIVSNGLKYQFSLIPTETKKSKMIIDGRSYLIRPKNEQDRQAIEFFLRKVGRRKTPTVKEFVRHLKITPEVETVRLKKQKTHWI